VVRAPILAIDDKVTDPLHLLPSIDYESRVKRRGDRRTDVTLIGESGSGKEVLARRIHDLSHRRGGQSLHETIDQVLRAVLEAEGGNRTRAAERLGISLRTVQRHLARPSDRP